MNYPNYAYCVMCIGFLQWKNMLNRLVNVTPEEQLALFTMHILSTLLFNVIAG